MEKLKYTIQPDHSADESFQIVTDGLQPNTIYYIDQTFFEGMAPIYNKDVTRFVVSLQGLVNRDYGKTHQSLIYLDVTESDKFWLDYTMSENKSFHGMALLPVKNIDEFTELFAPQIAQCGIIWWDQSVPATANVAATVCGLEGPLPVRYTDEADSFAAYLQQKGVAVKQSLVGMFGKDGSVYQNGFVSCGSAKNDAYRWAYDNYFHRCSSRYIAYILDGAGCVPGTVFEKNAPDSAYNCLYNHDYYLTRRCFFFDLTCVDVERPCDDPDQVRKSWTWLND